MTPRTTVDITAPSQRLLADALAAGFDDLPLVVEGESKVVRRVDADTVAVRLKPTLFSFSANRTSVVPGTERLRLSISAVLWQLLIDNGVAVPVRAVGDSCYVSDAVKAPPVEVVVKAAHVGTPKHLYVGMGGIATRHGGSILPDCRHEPYVRFDWRNPLPGKDECLPLWLADNFIDTQQAELTALTAFGVLSAFLASHGIALLDICFFISEDGTAVFGELSPDCMRAKYEGSDLDKDLWRKGKDDSVILRRWTLFHDLIQPR